MSNKRWTHTLGLIHDNVRTRIHSFVQNMTQRLCTNYTEWVEGEALSTIQNCPPAWPAGRQM